MSIFHSYDIRGVYGKELMPEDALAVGLAFGSFVQGKKIIVGRDVRLSSPLLSQAAIAGLLAAGKDVVDIGVASTPEICFAPGRLGADAALAVGASHNPPEYGGFKFEHADGTGFVGEELEEIYDAIRRKKWELKNPGNLESTAIREQYVQNIVENIKPARPLSFVVDVSNGAGGVAIGILQKLGHKVYPINAIPDGRFPAHPPEPRPDNLATLGGIVREVGADLGVAFDGDADRCVFLDEKGATVRADQMLMLFAKKVLAERKGKIIATVNLTQHLEEFVKERGGELVWSRVGRVFIDERLKQEKGILLGGEESCHFWFPDFYNFSEGPLAAAKATEILTRPLSQLISELPAGFGTTARIVCPEEKKDKVMEKVMEALKHQGEVITLDGVKLVGKNFWVLLRRSNTEPIIKLTAEAETEEEVNNLSKKFINLTEKIVSNT